MKPFLRAGRRFQSSSLPRVIFNETVGEWLLWFNLYYGTLHFYFDGFLWKLRRPALRAQL